MQQLVLQEQQLMLVILSNDHQVGQTGKVVVPDFILLLEFLEQFSILAGMKESKDNCCN